MRWKQLAAGGDRTDVLVFDKGDEVVATLEGFAREQRIEAASFTAIGAFSDVTVGYFDRERQDYLRTPLHEQLEVLSLVGDIATKDGEAKVHAHVVLGRPDATTRGGHLIDARVWPTLEVVLTRTPTPLRRTIDAATGLALLDPR